MTKEMPILLFVKYPQPGKVKTRLAESIGAESAATVYKEFVEIFLRRYHLFFSGYCTIYFDPAEEEARIRQWLGESYHYLPQPPGDLGRRLAIGFDRLLEQRSCAVALGSDSPDLPMETIQEAVEALERCDVVLGPALDGGYYLIGLSRAIPELFDEMPWSAPTLFERTVSKIDELGVSMHLLPPWHDIDRFEDLEALSRSSDPGIQELLKRHSSLFQKGEE